MATYDVHRVVLIVVFAIQRRVMGLILIPRTVEIVSHEIEPEGKSEKRHERMGVRLPIHHTRTQNERWMKKINGCEGTYGMSLSIS